MLESAYQAKLIKKLRLMFPGCYILKNDASYLQGVPDILILYKNDWAMLEVKRSSNYALRPNQEYYINELDFMSFARIIYPEIEAEVLHDLQHTFSTRWTPCIPERE